MPTLIYYTVDRRPEEIKELWDWAIEECRGKVEHENPYAMGVLACMEYLMGETEERPQDYKGVFTLANVLRSAQKVDHIRQQVDARVDEPLHNGLDSLRPGNPKCILYRAPLGAADASFGQGNVNSGNEVFEINTDNGS